MFGISSERMDVTADEQERAGFRVRGRVQGVGFRAWAARRAAELGLTGWVRNAADGSVEVRVAGARAAVARYRQLLESGPPLARIDEITVVDAGAGPLPTRFEIR